MKMKTEIFFAHSIRCDFLFFFASSNHDVAAVDDVAKNEDDKDMPQHSVAHTTQKKEALRRSLV